MSLQKSPPAAWQPSNGPAGWGRAEPGGRRLLWLRIMPRTRHVLAWPWLDWKRHHGWAAQCCHYRRRIQPTGLQLY